MSQTEAIFSLWQTIDQQNWERLPSFFAPEALIHWHNTNERFTVSQFVQANSQYPGHWQIDLQKLLETGETVISVVRVQLKAEPVSFHATSFFQFRAGKILLLDEYWGDDGPPPQWRLDMGIGTAILPDENVSDPIPGGLK